MELTPSRLAENANNDESFARTDRLYHRYNVSRNVHLQHGRCSMFSPSLSRSCPLSRYYSADNHCTPRTGRITAVPRAAARVPIFPRGHHASESIPREYIRGRAEEEDEKEDVNFAFVSVYPFTRNLPATRRRWTRRARERDSRRE